MPRGHRPASGTGRQQTSVAQAIDLWPSHQPRGSLVLKFQITLFLNLTPTVEELLWGLTKVLHVTY